MAENDEVESETTIYENAVKDVTASIFNNAVSSVNKICSSSSEDDGLDTSNETMNSIVPDNFNRMCDNNGVTTGTKQDDRGQALQPSTSRGNPKGGEDLCHMRDSMQTHDKNQ